MQLRLHVQQEVYRDESVSHIRSPTADSAFAPKMHFIETAPSILREMPWIKLKEFKVHTVQSRYNCAAIHSLLSYQLLAGVYTAMNITEGGC